MKKLVSLILALVMVLACSVAMAEPVGKGSAKDFEELPEFFEPIGMKTKRGGDTVTVTLDGEVDALYVLWYNWDKELGCYVEAPEELEVVDGVAKYNAAGHKYQPGVYGAPMNISYGPYSEERLNSGWYTFANKFNATHPQYFMAGNGLLWDWAWGAQGYYNAELNNKENPYDSTKAWTSLPVEHENDYFVMRDRVTGNIITDAKVVREAVASVLRGVDEYRYIDIYDYRVSGVVTPPPTTPDPDITDRSQNDAVNTSAQNSFIGDIDIDRTNKSVKYWTLEKVFDKIGTESVVGFRIVQPWGVRVESHDRKYVNSEGGAYEVGVGDVAIFYDRAGNWIYEEITDTGDPFGVGEEGTVIYTYTKMKANSNERYWLSKVEVLYEEGEYSSIYQRFLPNAGKNAAWVYVNGNGRQYIRCFTR